MNPQHLLHIFPTFGPGGVQIRMAAVMNHLAADYRHTLVALDGENAASDRFDGGVAIEFAEAPALGGHLPARLKRIRKELAALRPDGLLTYNWGSIEWVLANKFWGSVPHIHLESGFGREETDRQIFRRALVRRLALRRIDALVVPSRKLARIAAGSWKVRPDLVKLIPNGADLARFAAGTPPEPRSWLDSCDLIVGTVAPLRPEKNLGRLVRAFAALPTSVNAGLAIVGDGAEREGLRREAEQLGIADRVHFAGYQSRPECWLADFDVYALSSDTEQMPNTIVQAMAASKPIVATDVGDVAEMVAPQNVPFVVPARNGDGYKAALETLLLDAPLRAGIGAANRARAEERYDQTAMFTAYRELFGEVFC